MLRRFLTGLIAALVAVMAGGALAGAVVKVPVPGLSGRSLAIAGALRTADGGGIIAARSGRNVTVARVQADGAVDLAYGTLGLVTPAAGAGASPTALAIDPASGAAWVGAVGGAARRSGAVIALDGSGAPQRRFGPSGARGLPTGTGGPATLAWFGGRLLVAAGTLPCRGCVVSLLNATTGHVERSAALPADALAPLGCHPAVTSAAFDRVGPLVSTSASGRGCAAAVVQLSWNLRPAGPYAPPAPQIGDSRARSALIVANNRSFCLSASGPSSVLLSAGRRWAPASAPMGKVLSLVPLGPGACAALITTQHGGVVAQMATGERRTLVKHVPSGVAPLAMFRCNHHLLIVGASVSGSRRIAVIVPVAVARGSFAAVHKASAARVTTGCD